MRSGFLAVIARLALASATFALCLVAAEGFLRWRDDSPFQTAGWRTWVPPEPRDPTPDTQKNQLGLRGRRITYDHDDFVVVLLGDSQVASRTTAYEDQPERTLEHYLTLLRGDAPGRVRVVSVGSPSWGQDQQLLMLREYLEEYRADLVLLWMTWENDIYDITFPTRLPVGHAKPTFWLEGGELRGPNFEFGEPVEPIKLRGLLRQVLIGSLDDLWEPRLPAPYRGHDAWDGPTSDAWQKLIDAGDFRGIVETEKISGAISLTPSSPRMQYSLDLMRALLAEIRGEVEGQGGRLALFWVQRVQPGKRDPKSVISALHHAIHSNHSTVMKVNGRFLELTRKQYEANVAYATQGLDAWRIPIELPRWAVSERDKHLNSAANDLLMRRLARQANALSHREASGAAPEEIVAASTEPYPRGPFPGAPHPIPGRVQFEHYDLGGEGVAYHDSDAGNNGERYRGDDVDIIGTARRAMVGWVTPGEWLEYAVDVDPAAAGQPLELVIHASCKSPDGSRLRVWLDGRDLTGVVRIPGSEKWGDYADVAVATAELPAGLHRLRVEALDGHLGLDYLDWRPVASGR